MGKLHLNLMADDEMRGQIREMLRGELRVVVQEERDRLLKQMLPAAINQALTVEKILDRLFPSYYGGETAEKKKLKEMIVTGISDAIAMVRADAREKIESTTRVDIANMIDRRISEYLTNDARMESVVGVLVKKILQRAL